MKGFAIGKVIEPTTKKTPKGRELVSFGLLVGQQSEAHEVWKPEEGTSSVYDACAALKDGESIIVVFGSGVGRNGRLRTYINDVRKCPTDLQKQLREVFS